MVEGTPDGSVVDVDSADGRSSPHATRAIAAATLIAAKIRCTVPPSAARPPNRPKYSAWPRAAARATVQKMKGQLNVKTPAEYIAGVDDKRRPDIAALDALIRKHAPQLEPVIMGGMLGCGPFDYRYASGREGEACKLSIASNASHISLIKETASMGLVA